MLNFAFLRLAGRQLLLFCVIPMIWASLRAQNEVLDLQLVDEDLP